MRLWPIFAGAGVATAGLCVALWAAPTKGAPAPAKAAKKLAIVDKPIDFGKERSALTISYRRAHYGDDRDSVTIEPRMVVLHWTDTPSFKSTWNGFNRVRASASREKLAAAGDVNVSAQFVVDRDGTVYRLMPETTMARHTIGLNEVAIGVENVGSAERPLTDAQVEANILLVRDLAARFPITHLIGHSEYRAFEGHPYFRERDPKYRNQKPDPGKTFLARVRKGVADLGLQGPPAPPAKGGPGLPGAPRGAAPAAAPGPALAIDHVYIVSRIGDGVPDDSPKHARADQPVTLVALLEVAGRYYSDAAEVRLGKRTVRARPLAEAGAVELAWAKLEPTSDNLSNTGTGTFSYQSIDYALTALPGWAGRGSAVADVRPTLTPDRAPAGGPGLGTMRFQLTVRAGERSVVSAGAEARRGRGSGGLEDSVHRVSLRRDDSYLGWLTELYGQPYIWASAGSNARTHQSERLEGSDCADFVTYGWRRLGHDVPYTWSEGLKQYTTRLGSGAAREDGVYVDARGRPIPFPKAGDLILFTRHVGALTVDRGVPGVLDLDDLMMHALFQSPAEETIRISGYGGTPIEVLRWKR